MKEHPEGTTWQIMVRMALDEPMWRVVHEHNVRAKSLAELLARRAQSGDMYRWVAIPPTRLSVEERIEAARVEERKKIGAAVSKARHRPIPYEVLLDTIQSALCRGERP